VNQALHQSEIKIELDNWIPIWIDQVPFFKSYNPNSKRITLSNVNRFPDELIRFSSYIERFTFQNYEGHVIGPGFKQMDQVKEVRLYSFNGTQFPVVFWDMPHIESIRISNALKMKNVLESGINTNLKTLSLTNVPKVDILTLYCHIKDSYQLILDWNII